ncbi:MAG: hypothetical protein GY796_11335, partial [Chloroflexi bacterium]|nr:hypothetical protein [Chloroflexota bacterium]
MFVCICSITVAVETLNTLAAQIEEQEAGALEPVADLETLLCHADLGHQIALRSDFYGVFWGVHTFGG